MGNMGILAKTENAECTHEPIFSIIIPHKNIPNLLRRCLDSIPKREDIEIIVVDDNSDPTKVSFEQFPGLNEPHTTVIFTKEGKGAGYARNVGLERARGKWLLFADADDFYNYCFSAFLDEHCDDEADVVYFKSNSVHYATYTSTNRGDLINHYIDLYNQDNKNDRLLRYYSFVPWCKMIKKQLINTWNIRFDEIPKHNDVTFAYLVSFQASRINTDKHAIYCLTQREDSLDGSGYDTIEKYLTSIQMCAKANIFFKTHKIGIKYGGIYALLLHLYLRNKPVYTQARAILLDFGYTPSQIRNCIVKGFWNTVVKRFVRRTFKALCPYGIIWLYQRQRLR